MLKRIFHSQLFKRYIRPEEKEFTSFVKAELLYRIDMLNKEKCDCFDCTNDLKKYVDYYANLKESERVE